MHNTLASQQEPLSAAGAVHLDATSFDIVRKITDSNLLSKLAVGPTAKLVLFNIANMYNPRIGYCFPRNEKLQNCTGASLRAINQAVKELAEAGVVASSYEGSDRKMYFTAKFFAMIGLISEASLSAESAQGCAKTAGGSAESARPCHEQRKEQKKNMGVKKIFRERSEHKTERQEWKHSQQNERQKLLKRMFEGDNYITNKAVAEVVVNSVPDFGVGEDHHLRTLVQVQEVWGLCVTKFRAYRAMEMREKTDEVFARKLARVRTDVQEEFKGFEKQISRIRGEKL